MSMEYESAHAPPWALPGIDFEGSNPLPLVELGEQHTTQKGDLFRRRVGSRDVLLVDIGRGDERPFVMGQIGDNLPPQTAQRAAKAPENESRMHALEKETNPDIRGLRAEEPYPGRGVSQIVRTPAGGYALVQRLHIAPLSDPEVRT